MTDLNRFFDFIKGKKIALVGLGISNTPLISMLLSHGAHVVAHDKKKYSDFDAAFMAELEKKGVGLKLGNGYLDSFDEDIIIKAPGIRCDAPAFVEAVRRGAYLTSEMELFFKLTNCRKIAITGSDGKTTTTTLTHLMLTEHYKTSPDVTVHVGGNIGKPLFAEAESIRDTDIAVLELSSFQLHAMEVSPSGATITNISPNHLDWHTDYEEYIDSKRRIFEFMKSGRLVLNFTNELSREMAKFAPHGVEVVYFSSAGLDGIEENYSAVYLENGEIRVRDAKRGADEKIMDAADILLPGAHNIENYMTAIAELYGEVDNEVFVKIARTFGGVAHRIELVRELDGVKYYNSSIDSSPSRTIAALKSFGSKKVIAIMGGYDKNIPYDVLGDHVCEHTRAIVLTGATAPKIRDAVVNCERAKTELPEIYEISDFKNAVEKAKEIASSGDVVILTPASASFDCFKNFEERGNYFKEIVVGFTR